MDDDEFKTQFKASRQPWVTGDEEVPKVSLSRTEKPVFLRFAVVLALVAAGLVHLNLFRVDHSYREYARAELLAAQRYVEPLPDRLAVALFPTNQRVFNARGDEAPAGEAIGEFREMQAASYYRIPFVPSSRVEVLVLTGFVERPAAEKAKLLRELDVGGLAAQAILRSRLPVRNCNAAQIGSFGWASGGYVLVDRGVRPMGNEEVVRCIVAGLSFVNGLPVGSGVFAFESIPPPRVSAIVLDFTLRCAYDGVSEVEPGNRSRDGITTRPSLGCVKAKIAEALAAQPAGRDGSSAH